MARLLLTLAVLAATHGLAFRAGGWYLRWRALVHQMRAAQTATTGAHRTAVLADYQRRIRAIVRLPHLPRFHARRSA